MVGCAGAVSLSLFYVYIMLSRLKISSDVARGKFVSGAKVLAAVPSISQPRKVYEDRLETGGAGKELSTMKYSLLIPALRIDQSDSS